jgi:hypothetical protein
MLLTTGPETKEIKAYVTKFMSYVDYYALNPIYCSLLCQA